ncbi:MAG TPA: polysaccharide pyruvyl transferase family protein [Rhodopila sp.]
MILYRWRGNASNFGDELNTILWPRLLPGFFDEDPAIRFLGIGSVLDRRHPSGPIKIVAGTGYGGYERKPRLDRNWVVHWVRGPRTAAMLGLPPNLALGDPAVLLPTTLGLSGGGGGGIGFMPHFESAARGAWQQVARQAGVRLIDPRDDPRLVLDAIGGCKLLLSEALHGAIIADALRVPWIATRPLARIHRAKWDDWADVMALRVRFHRLPASTVDEWSGALPLRYSQEVPRWFGQQYHRMRRLAPERLIARASLALRQAIAAEPQLSTDAALHRCQARMLDAVGLLAADPLRRGSFSPIVTSRCLQAGGHSAYQPTPIG